MSSAERLLKQIFREELTNIHTSMPCSVVAYYKDTYTADIQPLFVRTLVDGSKIQYQMLCNVPIAEHVIKHEIKEPDELEGYIGLQEVLVEDKKIIEVIGPEKTYQITQTEFKIVIPLKEGDIVFVNFAERALDGAGHRKHDLTDAVIVGRLLK